MLAWRVVVAVLVENGADGREVVRISKSRISVLLRVMRDGGQRSMMGEMALKGREVVELEKG